MKKTKKLLIILFVLVVMCVGLSIILLSINKDNGFDDFASDNIAETEQLEIHNNESNIDNKTGSDENEVKPDIIEDISKTTNDTNDKSDIQQPGELSDRNKPKPLLEPPARQQEIVPEVLPPDEMMR